MSNLILPDDIDFSQYELETDSKQNVKNVGVWMDGLIHRLRNPDRRPKVHLPWEKAKDVFNFRPGEVTVWAGQNGHGKTGLVNQVMLSLIGQDQKVCIASFEAKPEVTLGNMGRMYAGTNPYSPEYQNDQGIEALVACFEEFRDWSKRGLWLYDQQGTANSAQVIGMTRYCAKELGINHVLIDNLAKCVRDEDDYNAQKKFVGELCSLAMDNQIHVHIVHHMKKPTKESNIGDKADVKGSGAITDQPDNLFLVCRNKDKEDDIKARGTMSSRRDEPDAYLLCRKNRHGEGEPTIGLWFHRDSKQFIGSPDDGAMFFPNFPHRPT